MTRQRLATMVILGLATTASVPVLVWSAGTAPSGPLDGQGLYRTYCASCHGISGTGNGPAADALRTRPMNLTEYAMKNGGVFPTVRLQRIIDGREVRAHGTSEMPVWGDAFKRSAEQLDDRAVSSRIDMLVRYLESIQQRPAR